MTMKTAWLRSIPDRAAHARLFCFPYAGAGSLLYRRWRQLLPVAIDVCPVQLPGRENRIDEPAHRHMTPLVDAAMAALRPAMDRPFALFGHSMGALVAYELARRLEQAGPAGPMHLFVSGMEAPDQRRPRTPLHLMADEEFIAELRALEGTAAEVFDAPELLAAVVPTLRADFEVCETHAHRPGPPLGCPITAFGGLADPQVSRERLLAWRRHTAIGFRSCMVAGDHFFIRHAPGAVLDRIAAELACEPALAEAS